VHAIGNLSVQTGTYRGRRFLGFTLDLSNYTGTRSERITQIEFWTSEGKQATRRARLIYEPGASKRPPARDAHDEQAQQQQLGDGESGEDTLPGEWGEQTNIYDLLPDDGGGTASTSSEG